jgi:hypothetical protein
MHPFTGPWRIVKSLPGASFNLKFASNPSCKDKKHASNLSPYPPELMPFQPLDGADSHYSQLYKQFGNAPYKETGIDSFKSPQPFAVPAHFACQGNYKDFHFPTLSKLNDKFDQFLRTNNDKQIMLLNPDAVEADTVMYNDLLPSLAHIQLQAYHQ